MTATAAWDAVCDCGATNDGPDAMTAERWLPVVWFEGQYEVSDCGRVRSLDRKIKHVRGGVVRYRNSRGRMLSPGIGSHGYPLVMLGRHNPVCVHILVLNAFVGPCPDGMWTRHLDDERTNAHLSNLCWGTLNENLEDSYINNKRSRDERTGRFAPPVEAS